MDSSEFDGGVFTFSLAFGDTRGVVREDVTAVSVEAVVPVATDKLDGEDTGGNDVASGDVVFGIELLDKGE